MAVPAIAAAADWYTAIPSLRGDDAVLLFRLCSSRDCLGTESLAA
jgi:hypothetical protein